MKKKLLTAVLSMVLCLGMSVTAFAAPSVNTSASDAYATVNGQQIELSISSDYSFNEAQANTVTETLLNKFEGDWQTLSDEEYEAQSERVFKEFILEQTGISATGIQISNIIDITNVAGVDLTAGVPITFRAAGVSTGDLVVVLHLTEAGQWENIPAVAGDGVITGTFTSLSPVFYAKITTATASDTHTHSYAETVVAPTETTWGYTMYTCACGENYVSDYVAPLNGAATETATSPKTADSAMPAVAAMVALVAVAGVVVVSKRKVCVR